VVKDFFEKAPPGTSPKFALTTDQDVSQLVTQIGSLPGVPIEYVQPETASFAQILAAKFGIPAEAFSTAFDQMRDQLTSQAMAEIEKERRALEQLRQEQAAAEAKGNAKDAEQARKIAALQEQLERHEERIARARPSIYKSVVDGITYLPRVLLKQFA
jgi:septal ring factor EnvC (AmiA/AmiB activator)